MLTALLLARLALAAPAAPAAPEAAAELQPLPATLSLAGPLPALARRALLEAYAPVVLLAPGEQALPVSVEWFLARSRMDSPAAAGPRLRPSRAARGGSDHPADWATYGHVYRAPDGGVLVQYWFLYAYNAYHGFGDHEGDWEHITVRLDPDGQPLGAWYSRHDLNAPGPWLPWEELSRDGLHPVVLSAWGSHASYGRHRDVTWLDTVCPAARPEPAAARGCPVWRTWDASTGGVLDLGSRSEPAVPYLLWSGRWGAVGKAGDKRGGPPGPAFQAGWCSGGSAGCG